MSRSSVIVVTALAIIVLGAAPAPSADAVRTEVQAFVKAYVEAQNKADASATMEMVSKKAGVASIAMGEITRGWEAIRNGVDATVGSVGQVKIAVGTIDVSQLGANFVLAFAPCTITLTAAEGELQLRGALTLVLERSGKTWKVFHEHTSAQLQTLDGD